MWKDKPIELALQSCLKADTSIDGELLYSRYLIARGTLVEQILPWIRKEVPTLTDHGPDHIANVLENVDLLLGVSASAGRLQQGMVVGITSMEFFILCMAALFHDVGNLFGRMGHNEKIAKVYTDVFNGLFEQKDEKVAVVLASRAHTGINSAGGNDTLYDLGKNPFYVRQKPVNLTTIGALVRLADELAEGPQRTSTYLLRQGLFKGDEREYHEYARITEVVIDRGNGRIALTYRIELADCKEATEVASELERVRSLLAMIYHRVTKLDQERRYARYYCDLLSPFKLTTVAIEFWADNWQVTPRLSPIQLSDLVVPGEVAKPIFEHDRSYVLEAVLESVRLGLEKKA